MAPGNPVKIEITVTADEHERVAELAQRRGFTSPDEYLRALIELDAEQHGEEQPFATHEDLLADFRQSWHEAMTGQTRPLSELWDSLDDD